MAVIIHPYYFLNTNDPRYTLTDIQPYLDTIGRFHKTYLEHGYPLIVYEQAKQIDSLKNRLQQQENAGQAYVVANYAEDTDAQGMSAELLHLGSVLKNLGAQRIILGGSYFWNDQDYYDRTLKRQAKRNKLRRSQQLASEYGFIEGCVGLAARVFINTGIDIQLSHARFPKNQLHPHSQQGSL